MSDLTPEALAWLAAHHHVITTPRLRASSVGRSTTDRLVRARVLLNPHKGVYVLAASQPTIEQRCAVLCAAHPSGFVTGPTAGKFRGVRRLPTVSAIHYALRHGIHLPEEKGVVFRQTRARLEPHRFVRPDGIAVAKPGWLAFDLAKDLPPLDHLSVLHQLLDEGQVTYEELVAIGVLLCHPARPGSTRYLESLNRLGCGSAAQSHQEVELADALERRGVPIERQSRVVREGGRLIHVDLAVPAIKWGIELDIHPEHRSLEGHGGDARRYRSLHLLEWQIEPVSEADMADVEALAHELCRLYHARRRRFDGGRSVS